MLAVKCPECGHVNQKSPTILKQPSKTIQCDNCAHKFTLSESPLKYLQVEIKQSGKLHHVVKKRKVVLIA